MSNTDNIKKKLRMLKRSPCKEIIYDAIREYVVNHRNSIRDVSQVTETIAMVLEQLYLQQIPKKQPKVKHYDLEDMVRDIRQLEKEQLERAFKKK